MIATSHTNPTDASGSGLFDRQITRGAHGQVTQTIVAINESGRHSFVGNFYFRSGIADPIPEPRHLLAQPKHTVGPVAKDICIDHAPCDLGRVRVRNAQLPSAAESKSMRLSTGTGSLS